VLIPWGTFSWDITQLSPAGRTGFMKSFRPKCGTCGDAVQVAGECHFVGSLNYVAYGTMMRLCHGHYKSTDSWKAGWHTEDFMIFLVAAHKSFTGRVGANVGPSADWAAAGYRGWPDKGRAPGGDRKDCDQCPDAFRGSLTVQWYPHVIRPGP
jgi:hypothetical protein